MNFELTLRSGRIAMCSLEGDHALQEFGKYMVERDWVRATFVNSIAQPTHVDWLPRIRTSEIESYRRIS